MKIKIKSIVLVLITVIIFSILFTKIDFIETIKILKRTNLLYLMVAFFLSIITNVVIAAHKWFLIVKELEGKIHFREVLFIKLGSAPLATILPAKSGELLKIVYLKKKYKLSLRRGASSLLFNALTDSIAVVLLLVIGIMMSHIYSFKLIYPFIFIFIFIFIFCLVVYALWKIHLTRMFILSIFKKISKRFHDIIEGAMVCFEKIPLKKTILLIFYNSVFNFLLVLIYYMIFLSLNVTVPIRTILIFMPLIMLISLIPITVSGFGTREASIILFFSKFASAETLLSVGLLVSFTNYILPSLIGLFFVRNFMKAL